MPSLSAQAKNISKLLGAEGTRTNDNPCRQCSQYCQILSNILEDLVDVHLFSNVMSTSSETQWNLDMCRASTFNLLHKAAMIKEMAGPTSATRLRRTLDLAQTVSNTAISELEQLRALPPTSHKWTWGKQLMEADILTLGQPSTQAPHSRYNVPLRSGNHAGQPSNTPSMPTSHGINDVTSLTSALPDYPFPGFVTIFFLCSF